MRDKCRSGTRSCSEGTKVSTGQCPGRAWGPPTFSASPGAAGAAAAPPGARRVLPEPFALRPHAGPEEVVLVLRAGGRRGRSLRAARGSRGAAAPGGLAVPLCATAVLGRIPAAGSLALQRILIGSPLAQPLESFHPAAAVSQLHCHPAGEERGPGEAPPRSLAARLPLNMAAVVCSRSSHGPPAAARPSQPPRNPDPEPRAPAQTLWPRAQGRQGHRPAARWPRPDSPARAAPQPVRVERDPGSRVRD